MRRIAEDESKRRAMVEEDSSRRGSLLDELREEEEMRLRLLQVEKLEIEALPLLLQEEHVQRVEEQAMREAVWEEECRRQQEENRWEQEMKMGEDMITFRLEPKLT